ncbi:MAG: 6-phosphogluconolactonase [Gammaproteobacteria bacterium]|nr:6-phosphogluconolactonase [Gammaproteobacteria bacterium]
MHTWCVYSDFDKASKAAADFLAAKIEEGLHQRGVCHVILPGGNTPARCLSYLTDRDLAWSRVHWYLGDERCYPAGHAERNDVMLDKNLWSRIPVTNVHRIQAELGAEEAARIYRELILGIDFFDVAFLGMGEDGHTASLFPKNEALQDSRTVIPVYGSPKMPAERVSLSITTLKNAQCRMVLTAGSAKADIIRRIKNAESLPINCIGDITWFTDEEAVPVISP